jgi:hypothetical protein
VFLPLSLSLPLPSPTPHTFLPHRFNCVHLAILHLTDATWAVELKRSLFCVPST